MVVCRHKITDTFLLQLTATCASCDLSQPGCIYQRMDLRAGITLRLRSLSKAQFVVFDAPA
jgi:hypothetical protein